MHEFHSTVNIDEVDTKEQINQSLPNHIEDRLEENEEQNHVSSSSKSDYD